VPRRVRTYGMGPKMRRRGLTWVALLGLSTSSMLGCGGSGPAGREAGLNLYTWSDYLAPDTIASFEKQSGVKVHVSYFDTNETLEARMLTGSSGFDVVVPTAPYMQRQIRSGAYLPLDKKKLPNLVNLDPAIMSRVAVNDPGNMHGIVYAWGTYGIAYNAKLVEAALPQLPLNSWGLVFDPAFAAKLAPCGISFLEDLADAEAVLSKIRPYIRNIDSSNDTEALANGDVCAALTYNGTFVQARNRARDAKNGITLSYVIPKEGSLLWFDMLAIPRDAPHVDNAHLFLNYLMTPQVIAHITNFIGNANANSAATPLLDASTVADPAVYPPPDQEQRLFVQVEDPPERMRAITRVWQKFKTAQ
jgi:putrescine transport system substrate-binding protein